jgi:hypothetical protein
MKLLLRIVARADGARTEFDGQFIKAWDFDAATLDTTMDPRAARHFANAAEALGAWRSVHEANPVRPDGKPNRPLTAFTVEIVNLGTALRE